MALDAHFLDDLTEDYYSSQVVFFYSERSLGKKLWKRLFVVLRTSCSVLFTITFQIVELGETAKIRRGERPQPYE